MKGTALITGASAGIGRNLATLFAADGHDLILVARRRDRLEELAKECAKPAGSRSHIIDVDLTNPSSAKQIQDEVNRAGLSVDFLVNNAGFGSNGPLAQADLARELAMVQVNVTTVLELTRRFVPGMVERGRGRILMIGSTAGFQPGPYMATYYATKAFVNSFTEALAFELSGTGVTATLSCPGATDTEFAGHAGNDKSLLFRMGAADSMGVARQAYRAMMAGKRLIIHGLTNKLGVQSVRVSPRRLVLGIAARVNRP